MKCPNEKCAAIFVFALPPTNTTEITQVSCPACAHKAPIADFRPELVDGREDEVAKMLNLGLRRQAISSRYL